MGKVIMSGIVPPLVAPIGSIIASNIAIGSVVYLMENGVATEYLVVNQGKPSNSVLYDDSCNGTWLLRKNCLSETRQWNSSNVNDYENSTINTYLNSDFFNLFGSIEKDVIKLIKIPYRAGSGSNRQVTSGENGLSVRVFLLSASEMGNSGEGAPISEGALTEYFNGDIKGNLSYFSRSPYCYNEGDSRYVVYFIEQVGFDHTLCSGTSYVRPALVIPSTAVFDKTTMLLKGVA